MIITIHRFNMIFNRKLRKNLAPKKVLQKKLKKNIDRFSGEKKKLNKCRVLKALSLRSLVRQRVTALAEVQRLKTAGEFFALRQQVLRRIFTERRRTAWKQSRASSARCSSHHAIPSRNASRKLTRNIFTSRRTKPSTPCCWRVALRARRAT